MDDLVRELNKLGYQPIFLPRTNIEPPELYNYSPNVRRLVRRGPLKDYLPDAAGLDVESGKLSDINYSYTSSKKGEAATSFLQNALTCIGISSIPKIKTVRCSRPARSGVSSMQRRQAPPLSPTARRRISPTALG
jgi:hypothetical protein